MRFKSLHSQFLLTIAKCHLAACWNEKFHKNAFSINAYAICVHTYFSLVYNIQPTCFMAHEENF